MAESVKYQKKNPPKVAKKPPLMKYPTQPQPKPRTKIPQNLPKIHRTLSDHSIMETTSLRDLVVDHSKRIPLSVSVIAGNVEYEPNINLRDSLIIHGIKQSHVITIVNQANEVCSIPFHSAAKFGIIGNLESEEYMSTFSVTELMECPNLPPIVACLGNYREKDGSMSFKQFEVLLLKDISTKGFLKPKTVIRAYSMTGYTSKFISKECNILFSVDPSGVQLYPSEILEYASHLLPCRARPFVPKEYRALLKDFTATVIVIEGQSTDTSLLVCKVDQSGSNKEYLEISTDVDIIVTLEDRRVTTTEQDIHHTKYTRLSSHRENVSECILKMIRKGKEAEGVKITHLHISEADNNVDEVVDSSDSELYDDVIVSPTDDMEELYDDLVWDNSASTKSVSRQDRTSSMINLSRTRKPSAPPALPSKSPLMTQYQNMSSRKSWAGSIPNLPTPVVPKRKQSRLSDSAKPKEDTASRVSGSSSTTDETLAFTLISIQRTLSVLVEKVEKLENNHSLLEQRLKKLELNKEKPKKRKKTISSMNQVDIQDLLEKLGMPQYRYTFLRRWVDGEAFHELNEESLKELGVESEEDRLKLLEVIVNGHY